MANLFERASESLDKGKKIAGNTFKNFINYISYAIIIAITILLSWAYLGFKDGFSWDLVIQTGILIVINITSMSIFIPQGEDNEKQKSKTYNTNLQVWGEKVKELEDKHLLMDFRKYCDIRTEEIRQEKREEYIKSTSIDLEFYNKHLKELSIKELKILLKPHDERKIVLKDKELETIVLTKKDFKALKKAKGKIKVSPISYSKVLAGSIRGNTNYALQEHSISYKARSIGSKAVSIILYTAIIAFAALTPTGATGFQAVLDMMMRLFGVTISTVMGFYTGIKAIRIANSDNKEKILFIDEFLETQKKE